MKTIKPALIGFTLLTVPILPHLATAKEYTIGVESRANIERAKAMMPDNYALDYYLGEIYLREGNRNAAINAWESYVSKAPEGDRKRVAAAERLTVLKVEQARLFAQSATTTKQDKRAINKNTVAVLELNNKGGKKLIPFIKGLSAMVMTDLAKVPQLRVVERTKIQALSQEIQLGLTSGLIDQATAPKMGRMLQARSIAWGDMGISEGDQIRIHSLLSEIIDNTVSKESLVEGDIKQFFTIEKQIVYAILEGMGLKKENQPPEVQKALEADHTTDFAAFAAFGKGLQLFDKGDFSSAKSSFQDAADLDPNFTLAVEAATVTPLDSVAPILLPSEPIEAGTSQASAVDTALPITTSLSTPSTDIITQEPAVIDVVDTTTTAAEATTPAVFQGPEHWFLSTIMICDDSFSSLNEVFVGESNGENIQNHNVNGIKLSPESILVLDQDNNIVVSVQLGSDPSETINLQGQYTQQGISQYIEWGYFTSPSSFNYLGFPKHFSKVWYVDGADIENPNLTGTVNYSGQALGTYFVGGTTGTEHDLSGTFSCVVDYDAGSNQISNFQMNLSGDGNTVMVDGGSGSFITGGHDPYAHDISFTTAELNGVNTVSGKISGTVYGPGGEHLGGAWGLYETQQPEPDAASGIYIGDRQ